MPKHIDRQREGLLLKRDTIRAAFGPEAELPEHIETQLDEINAALAALDEVAELDEVADLADNRPHPRLKVRLIPEHVTELDLPDGHRWLVSVRDQADDDVERTLGAAIGMREAHDLAETYVAAHRFFADRFAHPHGAGL